jgi:hypothetical protein
MPVEQIQAWKTTDGKLHENSYHADLHQKQLDLVASWSRVAKRIIAASKDQLNVVPGLAEGELGEPALYMHSVDEVTSFLMYAAELYEELHRYSK